MSLTTHGRRIRTVFLTVESIAAGRLLPSRMILWLDDPALLAHPPRSLRRLQARGLEIRRSENFGPHTKYFPFVEGEAAFPLPLATADDDLIYPVSWLERLAVAFGEAPEFVNCYRAHRVRLEDGKLARYGKWGRCTDTRPSYLNFATGVSGVIYPPALLAILKAEGRGFRACCPRADDIWLHAIAIRSGFRIRQIQDEPLHFPLIPLTQGGSLNRHNLRQDGNDPQIQATYQAADIERLLEEASSPAR